MPEPGIGLITPRAALPTAARVGSASVGAPTVTRQNAAPLQFGGLTNSAQGRAIGVPQFSDNPIGAIGFALQSLGAGLQGRELPHVQMMENHLRERYLRLQQVQVGSQVLEQGLSLIERAPAEQRPLVIEQFASNFADSMPGIGEILTEMAEDLPNSKELAARVTEFSEQAFAECGDNLQCIREFASDEKKIKRLQEQRDETNMISAGGKLREMMSALVTHPATRGQSITLEDIIANNNQAPEEIRLTDSEIRTLRRNEDQLAAFGIRTTKTAQVIQETMAREQVKAMFFNADDDSKSRFGNSMDGLALDTLLDYKAMKDAGVPIPRELEEQARVAAHILSRERLTKTPEGDLVAVSPMGVPPGLEPDEEPDEELDETVSGPTGAREGERTSLRQVEESKLQRSIDRGHQIIIGIADLLDEAAEAGDTITGLPGALKRGAGGLARQAGVPVSPRSENLARQLEILKAQVVPAILAESGRTISDQDRARVDKMVSDLSGFTQGATVDEVGLRSALAELLGFLGTLQQ